MGVERVDEKLSYNTVAIHFIIIFHVNSFQREPLTSSSAYFFAVTASDVQAWEEFRVNFRK